MGKVSLLINPALLCAISDPFGLQSPVPASTAPTSPTRAPNNLMQVQSDRALPHATLLASHLMFRASH